MIGFYLTTTGEYSPEQVADISNSIILDDKNKTFKAMNQYVFEFLKLSADYENLTADSSREGLSIYGAKAMYQDLYSKIPEGANLQRIESSINTLEEWQTVVNASVDTINSSISSLETWHDGVNTSIADINSSISAIKTDYIPNASMGVNGGVATLDASGRVPSSQLPSYVDDIIEGYLYEGVFYEDEQHEEPITGEGGKIYVDLTTNTSWRWGGSAYTQVSESLALGETDGTAYEGSKGKALKDAFDLHESSAAIHITDDERTAWNNASDNSHTHDNKNVLDSITAGDITNFIDASNAKHTHTNAGILDGLTDTSISNWDDAAAKAHEHNNKALLDGIADSSFHSHSNKSALDNISSADITNWNDASNAKHTHSNSAILNGITDASISAWDEGEANVNADWNATEGDASILNRPTLGDAAEKDVADVIESSTGALVTDGAIKVYVDDTISKAHEHTNKGILDGIADSSFHSHSNKNILDAIIDASVDAWNNAADDAHTHDNISVLDEITSTDVTNWNDASNKKHEHNNKAILDGIADSSFHEHDNKSVLDEITTDDVTNWNDASNKKHEHSNKDILDGIADSSFHEHDNKSVLDSITSTDVANWIDASNNQHTHSNSDILNGFTDASIAEFIKDTSYGQGSVQDLITGTDTTPMVWDASVINAYVGQLDANAVRYKGDINAGTGEIVNTSDTLTSIANKKGDVYVVSTEGTLCGVDMQVGDSIIFKKNVAKGTAPVATDLTFVQGTVKVTNEDATLQWGQLTKIANVEGVDISVGLPEDPAIALNARIADVSAYAIEVSSYVEDVSSRLDTTNTTLTGRIENVSTYAINVSTYAEDVSSRLATTDSTLTGRIENVSTYAINVSTYAVNVSTYASDVSNRLNTVNTTLTGRIANVSTYAINVSTYSSDVSSRLATVNTTLTGRIADVSAYAINVSTYAANVSTNHANDVSAFNAHFAKVDASLLQHDSSIVELYDNTYELTQVWAAAWYDISTHLELTDSSLDAHTSNATVHITAAERTAWADASAKKHEHSNKIILDGISDASVNAWNSASSDAHSHDNKALLDGITDSSFHTHTNKSVIDDISSTDVTNWNNASDNSHSHTNKTVLDGITDSSFHTHTNKSVLDAISSTDVTNWNNASDNSHSHTNKTVLDGITATDVTNWIDASNAKHSHSNAGILNGLTDTSISNWNTAATNNHTHSNKTLLDGIADSSFHTHANKGILDGLTDTSISNWNTAYSWGNHANAGYAQQSYAADVSSRLATVNTTLTTRVQNVSTYAINVSTYAANVSTYAANVSTNLATDYQNSLNTAAMFMLANFAGLPTTLNSPEYKYVMTDASSAVLLGKRQDDTWFFGDDTDTLMDAILDTYAQDDTLFSNMYRLSVAVSLARMAGDLSEVSNPEYKWVILDSSSHVLMGIKQDNTWYLGATINEILDCALDTYAVAGATHGTFANKPTEPNTGQMYFATDKQTTEGATNGIPIWYNGTNWVDALGRTVS